MEDVLAYIVVGRLTNPAAERTLLCYGHYDVQPPEPLELWDSDPFAPNENMPIDRYLQGIGYAAAIMEEYGKGSES